MKKFYDTVIEAKFSLPGRIAIILLSLALVLLAGVQFSKSINVAFVLGVLVLLGIVTFLCITWLYIAFYINFAQWVFTNTGHFEKIFEAPKKFFYFLLKLLFSDWEHTYFCSGEKTDGN